jgi:hypothetical protein
LDRIRPRPRWQLPAGPELSAHLSTSFARERLSRGSLVFRSRARRGIEANGQMHLCQDRFLAPMPRRGPHQQRALRGGAGAATWGARRDRRAPRPAKPDRPSGSRARDAGVAEQAANPAGDMAKINAESVLRAPPSDRAMRRFASPATHHTLALICRSGA